MTMIITQELLEAVIGSFAEEYAEDGFIELFETNSRNRRVTMTASREDEHMVFNISDRHGNVGMTTLPECAVLIFNHYASKEL